ncbi:NuA4 histone H4 acetyltransferase complex and the SWR1 complex subunit [Lithohypha guttulata]|uniref:Protein AF-9 homolog n=1 Tax=Lithohypha guttulata TaxID=1690604 RepID=A0AAN7SXD4_9EURO|nr:NuA4 histone H4 acetyltransferase complex and the SWR1 complex subunit [Lithohypha guttulata]KAK5098259.1 NuA4 histone H4 acetyltransferase complex and the SWR1 complex subunit [Lithohypha guttulata]
MPAPASSKRIRNVQIYRPFIFGSEATPFAPDRRPDSAPPDHTHKWAVFVKGIPIADPSIPGVVRNTDVTHWLRKVQFKLHDTYANSVRMVEADPSGIFKIEETGWGEFEIAIKFYFVPESGDIEKQKAERMTVKSICYEEVVFNEPVEAFYDILTSGADKPVGGKGKKTSEVPKRTAEIPLSSGDGIIWSRQEEGKELDRLSEAVKKVEKMIQDEKAQLIAEEKKLAELEKTEGKVQKKR